MRGDKGGVFQITLFVFLNFFFSFSVLATPSGFSEKIQTVRFYGINIKGNAVFLQKTKEALELLSRGRSLETVQRYVRVIQAGERSGMRADQNPPTYEVGMPTWNHSAVWYAGTIAHDAYHSKLYHEAKAKTGKEPPSLAWKGADAERICLQHQIDVLKRIGADAKTIEYVQDLSKNPTYQGDPDSAADYNKRTW